MSVRLSELWRKLVDYLAQKMAEPESGCGKCAVCHHVCSLLEKKPDGEEE